MENYFTDLKPLSLAIHDFSFSLYKELARTETGNIFYSPFSIHVILYMASAGAASKTFDEIIATIHLNDTTHSLKNYKDLIDRLRNAAKDYLKLVTGMFLDTEFAVKESFVEDSMKYLNSSVEKISFRTEPEIQRNYINNLVLYRTNNKISNLFPEGSITESTSFVLANAMHFKSDWLYKFNDAVDDYFFLTPNTKVIVKMMTLKHNLLYYHNNDLKFSALVLPYEYYTFKMVILLPDEKDGLKNLENNFSKIKFHEISNKMYDVTVKLPRFKLEQSFELDNILKNLGCSTMFTPAANFSNISDNKKLYANKVVHKAYIEVNELGTEAAAASGMPLCGGPFTPEQIESVKFDADCPFAFGILSWKDDLLFFSRLTNP